MLNVDWFEPFLHTKYPVGVMYVVVMNLPRHLRFKRENVILLGIIPGPSEPKHNINAFLKPFVEELLDFWIGIKLHVNTNNGVTEKQSVVLCCVWLVIYRPAEKLVGFLDVQLD